MAGSHTVRQGEHLAAIAAKYGFASAATLWNHPLNAELKQKRGNPNILYPGDVVGIPDPAEKQVTCDTGQAHRFRAQREELFLRIRLQEAFPEPIGSTPCRLVIDGRIHDLTTDADGAVEVKVPATASRGTLTVRDVSVPLRIGSLDPIDEPSGVVARLANLGYYRGHADEVDEAELRAAIEEFQCDQGLDLTGECDGPTRAKLEEVHGC